MKLVAVVLVALLAGCATNEPLAPEVPQPMPRAPELVSSPGAPFIWKSQNLTGNLALDVVQHPALGECTTHATFTAIDHADGPQFYSRGLDMDGTPNGSWSAFAGIGGGASVDGFGTRSFVEEEKMAGGFAGTHNVSKGHRVQYWANELERFESGRGYGYAFYLQIACTVPTHITVRASREALLAAPGDFHALATGGASLVGDAVFLGYIARDFSVPAEWWFTTNLVSGSFELQVETPEWTRTWSESEGIANQEPLPPGGSGFALTAAGAGNQFLLGVAAFQPVSSVLDIEALPNWA